MVLELYPILPFAFFMLINIYVTLQFPKSLVPSLFSNWVHFFSLSEIQLGLLRSAPTLHLQKPKHYYETDSLARIAPKSKPD